MWEYQDGAWTPYSPSLSEALTKAASAGLPSAPLTIAGRPYTVHFDTMVQVNDVTGFERRVRRRGPSGGACGGVGSPEVLTASGDGPPPSGPLSVEEMSAITRWMVVPKGCPSIAGEECCVCMEELSDVTIPSDVVRLAECAGHALHARCALDAFQRDTLCPMCKHTYSRSPGTQPGHHGVTAGLSFPV